jgi:hypothetical protein
MAVSRTISTVAVWGAVAAIAYIAPPTAVGLAIVGLFATMFIWRSV